MEPKNPRSDARVPNRCGVLVCPWCRRPTRPIAVHGHMQCDACGTNLDPCCGGERAQPEEERRP